MKLKSRLIEIAGAGFLIAFASSCTQGGVGGAIQSGAQGVGDAVGAVGQAGVDAVTPSQGPWTADNVTATRPFGNIDVSGAGTSTDSVRTWTRGRSGSELSELSARCGVINNPTYSARYPANAQQFCRNYSTASVAPPAAL
jgi:hypothetical protein